MRKNPFTTAVFQITTKPVLLIVGGSSGSKVINEAVRKVLPELLEQFYIIHLCGKGNLDEKLKGVIGYAQFEYASAELTDMFALQILPFPAQVQIPSVNFLHCTNQTS